MTLTTILFLGVLAVALVYTALLFNGLVALKHNVAKAWANIDVLLKQRHDELPKLIEVCKQCKTFEQETLQKVIEARSKIHDAREKQDVGALGLAEGMLRMGLGQIFALSEAYPELKTDTHFMVLQQRISGLENAIADRRELYNESVNLNNVRIEQFPDLLLACLFNFTEKTLLVFSEEEKIDVNVKQLFS